MGGSGGEDVSGGGFNPYSGNYGASGGPGYGLQGPTGGTGYNTLGNFSATPGQFGYGSQNGNPTIDPSYADSSLNLGGGNLTNIQGSSLGSGVSNLQQSSNQFLPLIQQYLGQGQQGVNQATGQGMGQLGGIYGGAAGAQGALGQQAQGQIYGMEGQNQQQVQSLLDASNKNFMTQLGPNGQLGQQMMGEFNNYGITPQSGAFQDSLGKQLGSLGAQNALTLGQQALQPGINAQYNTLGTTLQNQQGLLGQGAQQAGGLTNTGAITNQQLGSQRGTAPLSLLSNTLGQQQSLINEGTQLPIQNQQNQLGFQGAQELGNQNVNAQNYGAQMGLLGNLGGAGIGALGNYAAAGK